MESLIGMRKGKTVCVSEWYFRSWSKGRYKVVDVKCDCGSPTRTVQLSAFLNDKVLACKCATHGKIPARFIDHSGEVFSRLTVVRNNTEGPKSTLEVFATCSCGSGEKVYNYYDLTCGLVKSCGCLKKEMVGKTNYKHGMSDSKLYDIWFAMKDRCLNPNNPMYNLYGGRGISVCDEWMSSSNFFRDMSEGYADGLYIDRIDFNGDYCNKNCRWATPTVSNHNKRKRKGCSSSFLGVSYQTRRGQWLAELTMGGVKVFKGHFDDEHEAAVAYDNASEQHYGDRPNNTTKE